MPAAQKVDLQGSVGLGSRDCFVYAGFGVTGKWRSLLPRMQENERKYELEVGRELWCHARWV